MEKVTLGLFVSDNSNNVDKPVVKTTALTVVDTNEKTGLMTVVIKTSKLYKLSIAFEDKTSWRGDKHVVKIKQDKYDTWKEYLPCHPMPDGTTTLVPTDDSIMRALNGALHFHVAKAILNKSDRQAFNENIAKANLLLCDIEEMVVYGDDE